MEPEAPMPQEAKEPEPMPVIPIQITDDEQPVSVANTKAAVANRESEDSELLEHIAGFGMDRGYEVRVYRTSPKKWKGVSIEGHLGTFDEWMSEEDLKAMFGGGTLQLKIHRPNAKGSMQYLKAVSVKLPGPPRGEGVEEEEAAVLAMPYDQAPAEDSVLAQQAMSTMKELIDKKAENNAFDPTMIQMFMAPLQAQIAASNAAVAEMQRMAEAKDARIMELISAKPDTSEKDGLLNKMFDTESSRSEHLRNMHESEMRQMRENNKEESKRADDRHRDEQRRSEDIQRREIDNVTRSNDAIVSTLKMSYEARIDSLKADIVRMERDMGKTDTELVVLRAKKDKTIIEQASEFAQIKEAINTISGGGADDDDSRKWYEKLASQVIENPEAIGQFAGMVTGQNPAAPAMQQNPAEGPSQQQPQLGAQQPDGQEVVDVDQIPLGQPFRAPDGEVYVKVPPDGSIVTYEQALAMASDQEEKKDQALGKPAESDVKAAIGFMESAFQAGTTAETFALSAKAMIPQDILKYMEAVGVDTFLNEVAVLEQGSPLRNQTGRTYMREVAKYLLEGIPG
jgi:hypothetical protein